MSAVIVPASVRAERALAATVNELEIRYTGGTRFFDALDERLRDPFWFRALLDSCHDVYGTEVGLAVSGEFGRRFMTWFEDASGTTGHRMPILFPGDLRHTTLDPGYLRDFWKSRYPVHLDGQRYVFLDDSYYLGRTYGQIRNALTVASGVVVGAAVLYDGSVAKPVVPSLFRYHEPNSTRLPL